MSRRVAAIVLFAVGTVSGIADSFAGVGSARPPLPSPTATGVSAASVATHEKTAEPEATAAGAALHNAPTAALAAAATATAARAAVDAGRATGRWVAICKSSARLSTSGPGLARAAKTSQVAHASSQPQLPFAFRGELSCAGFRSLC